MACRPRRPCSKCAPRRPQPARRRVLVGLSYGLRTCHYDLSAKAPVLKSVSVPPSAGQALCLGGPHLHAQSWSLGVLAACLRLPASACD